MRSAPAQNMQIPSLQCDLHVMLTSTGNKRGENLAVQRYFNDSVLKAIP